MTPLGNRILKVNHAGEHGAVNIYAAQIWVANWLRPSLVEQLQEFKAHEENHRRIFAEVLQQRNVGRCASYHLCGVGGYFLGAVSVVLGQAAVFATTVAVEHVVLMHLREQIHTLSNDPQGNDPQGNDPQGNDPQAIAAIAQIVADEQHHHDQSLLQLNATSQGKMIAPLMAMVRWSTESVIWLGMKL